MSGLNGFVFLVGWGKRHNCGRRTTSMHSGNCLRMTNHSKRIDAMQPPSPIANRVGVSFLQQAHVIHLEFYVLNMNGSSRGEVGGLSSAFVLPKVHFLIQ
jgi:hypothetical protein